MARRHPTHARELRDIRALPHRIVETSASEVIGAVQRGLQTPESDLPQRPSKPPSGPHQAAVVDLLAALIKMRALEMGIAPRLLATQRDLEDLVQQFHNGPTDSLPLLQGWREEAVGADLLAFLKGTTALRLNPATGRVQAEPAGAG